MLIFLQVTSFIWILYLDTIILTRSDIAYFFDEFWSSWTAWLGFALLGCLVYVEKAVYDAIKIIKSPHTSGDGHAASIAEFNQVTVAAA